jgi:hypothetical protein
MREIIETTLITTVMYMTMERTAIDPIASKGAMTHGGMHCYARIALCGHSSSLSGLWGHLPRLTCLHGAPRVLGRLSANGIE